MNSDTTWQLVRHLLATVGTSLTIVGWMDAATVQALAGAITTIAMIAWDVYVKYNTRAVPARVADRPEIPVASPVTGKVT